jgi:hypothetical protein
MTSKFLKFAVGVILAAAALGAGSAQAGHRHWSYGNGGLSNPNPKWNMTRKPSQTTTTTPLLNINNGQPLFDSKGRLIADHNMPVFVPPPPPGTPMHF